MFIFFAFSFSFIVQAQFNIEHSVYFDTDLYNLTKTEKTRLQKFISSITKDDVQKIEIYGFCDDRGSNNYNLELSQNRAYAIKTIFGEASFFPEKIVTVDGRGELLLNIVDETDASVIRALNRRVDIVISYPEVERDIEFVEKKENKILLENVLFITGYSYLTMRSKRVLNKVAETLKKESFSFVIQGHVCCTEGEDDAVDRKTNKKNLSIARAKFVYDFLLEKGVSIKRMSYEGLAHKFPLGGSEDKDRRVEILILSD
ncbi:MAG: flagellar motor protein MotB [Flavobacteriaceae bacterium]|nr:flagellar motor protein MotB [Flavobacteriaceae bacterium]